MKDNELLKIYDNLFNVIGVATRKEVHEKGLLHQVVHLWMYEHINNEQWLYFQKRPTSVKLYPNTYGLIAYSHIDPEETFKEAMLRELKEELSFTLQPKALHHAGNIRQVIDEGDYHDNAFCQVYFCQVQNPQMVLSKPEQVIKTKLDSFHAFVKGDNNSCPAYTLDGKLLGNLDHTKWWTHEKEYLSVMNPFIKNRISK